MWHNFRFVKIEFTTITNDIIVSYIFFKIVSRTYKKYADVNGILMFRKPESTLMKIEILN